DQKYAYLETRIKELEGKQHTTLTKSMELETVESTIKELEKRLEVMKLVTS
ncbi:MAG: hypothetical protein HOD60_09870, partial [Candidatus Nitrosopelagicus sp.]|nr:hypothetical protein [Candidatus Nitrosopelagicus sp.]